GTRRVVNQLKPKEKIHAIARISATASLNRHSPSNFRLFLWIRLQIGGVTRKMGPATTVTVARLVRIVFGVVAGVMLTLAVGDVMLSGRLPIVSPASFGALLTVALAFLISNL